MGAHKRPRPCWYAAIIPRCTVARGFMDSFLFLGFALSRCWVLKIHIFLPKHAVLFKELVSFGSFAMMSPRQRSHATPNPMLRAGKCGFTYSQLERFPVHRTTLASDRNAQWLEIYTSTRHTKVSKISGDKIF
jgi:hypothetical protein